MGARRRHKAGGGGIIGAGRRLLLADAGVLAGHRLAHPSLDQLDAAVRDLVELDGLRVVILADAGLKRDLSDADLDRFERYRSDGTLTCAAAGSEGGHSGFMRAAADRAAARAKDGGPFDEVFVLTARDIGSGGWTLVRLMRAGDRWTVVPSSTIAG